MDLACKILDIIKNKKIQKATAPMCARWNQTTGPLGPYRFEACTHHLVGLCTQNKICFIGGGEFREETMNTVVTPVVLMMA